MSGKGSKRRPTLDKKTFSDNWDRIFSKSKSQKLAKADLDTEKKDADRKSTG